MKKDLLVLILLLVAFVAVMVPFSRAVNSDPMPPNMTASEMFVRVQDALRDSERGTPLQYAAAYSALRVGDWLCVFCDVRTQELRWKYVGPPIGKTWNILEHRWEK